MRRNRFYYGYMSPPPNSSEQNTQEMKHMGFKRVGPFVAESPRRSGLDTSDIYEFPLNMQEKTNEDEYLMNPLTDITPKKSILSKPKSSSDESDDSSRSEGSPPKSVHFPIDEELVKVKEIARNVKPVSRRGTPPRGDQRISSLMSNFPRFPKLTTPPRSKDKTQNTEFGQNMLSKAALAAEPTTTTKQPTSPKKYSTADGMACIVSQNTSSLQAQLNRFQTELEGRARFEEALKEQITRLSAKHDEDMTQIKEQLSLLNTIRQEQKSLTSSFRTLDENERLHQLEKKQLLKRIENNVQSRNVECNIQIEYDDKGVNTNSADNVDKLRETIAQLKQEKRELKIQRKCDMNEVKLYLKTIEDQKKEIEELQKAQTEREQQQQEEKEEEEQEEEEIKEVQEKPKLPYKGKKRGRKRKVDIIEEEDVKQVEKKPKIEQKFVYRIDATLSDHPLKKTFERIIHDTNTLDSTKIKKLIPRSIRALMPHNQIGDNEGVDMWGGIYTGDTTKRHRR